ncbi:hypothetical protein LHJ74_33150 [Streptomyces sp. N2-109]|uniref:Uncharacterized protein n=1 Tax=Streptomyces gossypii TaxID=2883101 RepID=A0ABT2K3N4_9ACTN|nr:hypothetical protein [Streptomyces gossypii]MCT2594706.1 hypothetical protein [Streptomyces gossypii]
MPASFPARAHRRPLITAAVAGGALFAVWFVPSAGPTGEGAPAPETQTVAATSPNGPNGSHAESTGGPHTEDELRAGSAIAVAEDDGSGVSGYLLGGLGLAGAAAAGGVLLTRARSRPVSQPASPASRS